MGDVFRAYGEYRTRNRRKRSFFFMLGVGHGNNLSFNGIFYNFINVKLNLFDCRLKVLVFSACNSSGRLIIYSTTIITLVG